MFAFRKQIKKTTDPQNKIGCSAKRSTNISEYPVSAGGYEFVNPNCLLNLSVLYQRQPRQQAISFVTFFNTLTICK
jgi:hypothetical protein